MDYDYIFLTVELGLYDVFQEAAIYGSDNDDGDDDAFAPASLCQMNVIQGQADTTYYSGEYGDSSECPFPGTYRLITYYKVPAITDTHFKYTPDIRFTLWNANNQRIGCVVTGPSALHSAADRKAAHGLVALAIALSIFLLLFAVLLFLSHRRKKRIEALREKRGGGGSIGSGTGSRAYQYFRTLPNGQVIPLPATTSPPSRRPVRPIPEDLEEDDDEDDDDALNISNPAYNETHMPTRPII